MEALAALTQLPKEMGRRRAPGKVEVVVLTALCVAAVLGCYFGLDDRDATRLAHGGPFFVPRIALDDKVPLWPSMIWPYLLFYPALFTLGLVALADRRAMYEAAATLILTGGFAFLLFLLVPSRMIQPDVSGCMTTSCRVLDWMYQADRGFHAFPSLHVGYPVGIWLLLRRYGPRLVVPFGVLVLFIMASTVLLKRHWLADVPAGIVVGAVAYALAQRIGQPLAVMVEEQAPLWRERVRATLGLRSPRAA